MLNKNCSKRKLTRKEQRDLDIEISFMEGVVQRDAKYVEAWKALSECYCRRGFFERGLHADVHLARLQPDDPAVLYDLACGYALLQQTEEAITALMKAIAHGFNNFKWLLKDPDLTRVRKDKLFKRVWTKISSAQTDAA